MPTSRPSAQRSAVAEPFRQRRGTGTGRGHRQCARRAGQPPAGQPARRAGRVARQRGRGAGRRAQGALHAAGAGSRRQPGGLAGHPGPAGHRARPAGRPARPRTRLDRRRRQRALQEVDAAAASAATVLAERRSQWALHAQSATPDAQAQDTASAGAALDAQTAQRALAHDAASALRLQLAQDDARRTRAQSMMADIDKQQQIELRWGRLNELIGSADGKKFRNYAQQFTLDVLLGYANSHLAQLARRYRLERVVAASGPSLGLLVRDQDMGGEIRSVNSLSGGESFLVSLALALGLASLSSNRVRVESLFIDEGFGSLDADTLRVAMDALDGLQSMGRKVGVISHVQEMTERIATRILVQLGRRRHQYGHGAVGATA
ncbi:hypothetical protein LP419_34125 [Massilia sp. H-1]|nr:hypothetical protein LP419_34125 [Massilia sp. H-1]